MNKQLNEVLKELERANKIHSLFTSEHEGMGVLQEEMYELWDAIRSNKSEDVYHEATQVAAMAVKLMMYIDSTNSRHSDDECDCENHKKYGDAFDQMMNPNNDLGFFVDSNQPTYITNPSHTEETEIERLKHRDCMIREESVAAFNKLLKFLNT